MRRPFIPFSPFYLPMCYAIPGRVVSVDGNTATLEYFGEKRKAKIVGARDAGLRSGGYAYAQGGIIVDTIPESEALAILETWKEQFLELRKKDESMARGRMQGELGPILRKAESGALLTRSEMKRILETEGEKSLASLYQAANSVRARNIQNACCVHGIIEFSNNCGNGCAYCGINKNNTKLRRYRMDPDEIVSAAEYAVRSLGFRALVLQSGEDQYYSDDTLVSIVKRIRERCGVLIFMSIGERSEECYRRLYEAGAYGALIRFETSNPKLYSLMRPGKKLDDRLALIRKLKSMGYLLATGFLAGLPGQTGQDLINDILLMKSLKPDMFSFGPLIPHPCTPLAGAPEVPLDHMLKTIALARLAAPDSHIVVTTALETLDKEGKRKGLLAGANSLMINVTPEEYKRDYDIYPGKTPDTGRRTQDMIRETLGLLHSLGRAPTDLGAR